MKIVIERSGGFAGIRRRYELEIDAAQLEALKSSVAENAEGADRFNYRVIVEGGQGSPTLNVSEELLTKVLGRLP